jgi:hypothetical protein
VGYLVGIGLTICLPLSLAAGYFRFWPLLLLAPAMALAANLLPFFGLTGVRPIEGHNVLSVSFGWQNIAHIVLYSAANAVLFGVGWMLRRFLT